MDVNEKSVIIDFLQTLMTEWKTFSCVSFYQLLCIHLLFFALYYIIKFELRKMYKYILPFFLFQRKIQFNNCNNAVPFALLFSWRECNLSSSFHQTSSHGTNNLKLMILFFTRTMSRLSELICCADGMIITTVSRMVHTPFT